MKLLIPGGAGYIGSHFVRFAQNLGHEVVVLDNFSTGHNWAVSDCEVINVDLLDRDNLNISLNGRRFDGVIHFAAKSLVNESINRPLKYFRNNFEGTMNLVEVMMKNNIKNLVFSSTAAIFGNPIYKKINEDHPKNPINPYGSSKLIVEQMLEKVCLVSEFNACCLRYFNAAGADPSGEIGECHNPETHLIPNVLMSCLPEGNGLKVYGDDYDTPDGTCIRDYIHVNDLAKAHLLGLEYIKKSKGFSAFNLGNGDGYSVLDVINTSRDLTGNPINFSFEERREGDPSVLIADSSSAESNLGWKPQYTELAQIISSAWTWHKQNIVK